MSAIGDRPMGQWDSPLMAAIDVAGQQSRQSQSRDSRGSRGTPYAFSRGAPYALALLEVFGQPAEPQPGREQVYVTGCSLGTPYAFASVSGNGNLPMGLWERPLLAGIQVAGQSGEPGQGPWMATHLRLEAGTIAAARYETYPCPNAHRCGAWVCHFVVGRTPEQLLSLQAEDLRTLLRLPLGKEHCADLAVEALRAAVHAVAADESGGCDRRRDAGGPGVPGDGSKRQWVR